MAKSTRDQSGTPEKPKSKKKGLLYFFSVAILLVIAITFVGGPAATTFMGEAAPRIEVGRYDGEPIEFAPGSFFERQFRTLAQQQPESRVANPDMHRYQLLEQAFSQAVFHKAVQAASGPSGMTVSSDRVDRALAQYPAFLENGRFSAERYRSMPSAERQALRDFLRAGVVQEKYLEDTVMSARFSEREREALKRIGTVERRFQYAEFRFDEISDAQLERYYSDHADEFTELHISQITVFGTEEDAASIYGQIEAGSVSFEELAQTHSDDQWAEDGGERGWVARHQLEREIESETVDELFDSEPGRLLGPIAAAEGYLILRLNEPARDPDLADADHRERVREHMLAVAPEMLETQALDRAEQFIGAATAGNFLDAAAEYEVDLGSTDYFPVNYGNSPLFNRVRTIDGDSIGDAAHREAFFEAAFRLQPGEISPPIELEDRYLVLRLEGERELEPGDDDILDTDYPNLLQDWQWRELDRVLFDPARIESRVIEVFFRYFSTQGR